MTLQVLEVLAGAIAGIGVIVGVFWFTFASPPPRRSDCPAENPPGLGSDGSADFSGHSGHDSGF